MATTLQKIFEPVLRDLGMDPGSSLINDAKQRLIDYVNEVVGEINLTSKWNVLKTQGTITLLTSQDTYTLATDCDVNRILAEEFYVPSEDKTIIKKDDAYFGDQLNIGEKNLPSYWRPLGVNASSVSQVQFYPSVASGYNNTTVTYYYVKKLSELSNTTDTTPHQEELIRVGIKAKYFEYDDDFARADRYTQRFSQLLRRAMAQNHGSRQFTPRLK